MAISAIEVMLSIIISGDDGPVFAAMSFVPAFITINLGSKWMASCLNLISIWGEVWPLIPLFIKLFLVKKSGSKFDHPSVIESPISTILSPLFSVAASFSLSSRYLLRLGQSSSSLA